MQMQPPNENRQQKRHSVEKRMSLEAKRSSLDKRASLEIKLHDGMIVVDEEERNRLMRKSNVGGGGGANGGVVINHPQVHNHFQAPPPARSVSSPTGGFAPVGFPGQPQYGQHQLSQRPPTQPGQQQFIPQGGFVHPNQRPPFNPQQSPMAPGMAFQGPPRQGSLTSPSQFSPPQFQQQFLRPPPPMQQQQQLQQQFPPSMMNMPPPSPQGFPGSGAPLQQQSQPMMPGSRPLYSGNVPPPLGGGQQPPQIPNQFGPPSLGLPSIGRHSPMLDLQSQTWDSSKVAPDAITPATLIPPGPFNNIPIGSAGPLPPVPAAAGAVGIKTPATIQEEEQFSDVEEDDEYYDDDNESAGSFLSFDEETEDNTEYNAIVDYDLLDMIMGGSTDYDAPMPRATHERRVVFNQLVKAQSLVRVLKDGEALSPIGNGGDPDGDTEFEESESEIEDDEYDQESDEEDEVYDESPPSPIIQVVNMLPLRPADLEGQELVEVAQAPPEITPRGVSLKMNPDGTIATESSSPPKAASAPLASVPQGVVAEFSNVASQPLPLPPMVTTAATSTSTGIETSPITMSGDAPSLPRKKVRHVQIQTRGATMKTQQTMTDLTMANTADFSAEFNEFPSGAVVSKAQPASATVDSSTASTTSRDEPQPALPDPRIADLESERDFLQAQNQALQETIARLQEEANARKVEREEAQAKFDKLSGQAMRKIKELVAERQVLEVEMEGLKGQVSGLESLLGKWTMEG
ncbi:UNVERIFIED_CONTAM: hypothetical protein HDU68_002074 [Siphonaria sp. JEL0065]|nr:hypothetical protein HDU68_002074 [Siphonaria sp. JEL0065]